MSQVTYLIRVIQNRQGQVNSVPLHLTFDQIAGISLAVSIFSHNIGVRFQIVVPAGVRQSLLQVPPNHVLFDSNRRFTPDIFNQLLQFNPAQQNLLRSNALVRNLLDLRTQRYVAFFLVPDKVYMIQFDTLEFLQGMITGCNWYGLDYHTVIPMVYDGDHAMTIE